MMEGDRDYYAGADRTFERDSMRRRLTIPIILEVERLEAHAIKIADQLVNAHARGGGR